MVNLHCSKCDRIIDVKNTTCNATFCKECNTRIRFSCKNCNHTYVTLGAARNHFKFICGKLPNISCDIPYCSYKSYYAGDMRKHLRWMHKRLNPTNKFYRDCPACGEKIKDFRKHNSTQCRKTSNNG